MGRLARLGSDHTSLQITYYIPQYSQVEDELATIHQQMYLISLVQGDLDEGLVDMDEVKKAMRMSEEISEDEIRDKSLSSLIMHRRQRRALWYGKHCTQSGNLL